MCQNQLGTSETWQAPWVSKESKRGCFLAERNLWKKNSKRSFLSLPVSCCFTSFKAPDHRKSCPSVPKQLKMRQRKLTAWTPDQKNNTWKIKGWVNTPPFVPSQFFPTLFCDTLRLADAGAYDSLTGGEDCNLSHIFITTFLQEDQDSVSSFCAHDKLLRLREND